MKKTNNSFKHSKDIDYIDDNNNNSSTKNSFKNVHNTYLTESYGNSERNSNFAKRNYKSFTSIKSSIVNFDDEYKEFKRDASFNNKIVTNNLLYPDSFHSADNLAKNVPSYYSSLNQSEIAEGFKKQSIVNSSHQTNLNESDTFPGFVTKTFFILTKKCKLRYICLKVLSSPYPLNIKTCFLNDKQD